MRTEHEGQGEVERGRGVEHFGQGWRTGGVSMGWVVYRCRWQVGRRGYARGWIGRDSVEIARKLKTSLKPVILDVTEIEGKE